MVYNQFFNLEETGKINPRDGGKVDEGVNHFMRRPNSDDMNLKATKKAYGSL